MPPLKARPPKVLLPKARKPDPHNPNPLNPRMDSATVFREVLGAMDDAIALAQDAVKTAQDAEKAAQEARQSRPQEGVVLVKVAKARYESVAETLHRTGAFREFTRAGLAKTLESAGPAGLLDVMEKLASRAVFPLDASVVLGGDLVEKSADSRTDSLEPTSKTAVWRKALDEAERECAG